MLFHGRWWVGVSEIAWHGTARHDMTCWTNGLREAKKGGLLLPCSRVPKREVWEKQLDHSTWE